MTLDDAAECLVMASHTEHGGDYEHMGHYYVTHPSTLPDVIRQATLARENAGLRAFIHHHAHGEPCSPDCREHMPIFGGVL